MRLSHIISRDHYITVNKFLIKEYGTDAAIILGEFAFMEEKHGNWFFFTHDAIHEATGIKVSRIRTALKVLVNSKAIKTTKYGLPCRIFYTINEETVSNALNIQSVAFDKLVLEKRALQGTSISTDIIRREKEKYNNKKNSSVTFQATRERFETYLNRLLTEPELEAIRININRDIDIDALCLDFEHYCNEKGSYGKNIDIDLTGIRTGTVGYIYMFKNDFDKFEEIFIGI